MSEDEIRQLIEEKGSENTKRTYRVAQLVFHDYLTEKRIAESTEKSEFAQVLKTFYVAARKKGWHDIYYGEPQNVEIRTEKVFQDSGRL